MKKMFFGLAALLLTFVSCGEENNDKPNGGNSSKVPDTYKAFVDLNPTNPLIFDITDEDLDTHVMVFGEKASNGAPKTLTEALVQLPDEDGFTEITLDEKKRPTMIKATNGVIMRYDWLSDDQVAISLVDPDAGEQLNTMIDFANMDLPEAKVQSRSAAALSPREGKATLSVKPLKSEPVNNTKLKTRADGGVQGTLLTTVCGKPTYTECFIDVYLYLQTYNSKKLLTRLPCTWTEEKGYHTYEIPSKYTKTHKLADYAQAIADVIGDACLANSWMGTTEHKSYACTSISALLAKGVVTAPVAAKFFVACQAGVLSTDYLCKVMSWGLPDYVTDSQVEFDSPVDYIISAFKELKIEWDDTLLLTPGIVGLNGNIYGDGIFISGGTPDLIHFDQGGKANISSFTLNPPAPQQYVGYNAIAKLFCIPAGSQVEMHIVGTDGYANTETHYIESDESNFEVTLHVPGSYSGVEDVCTVTVTLPSGETLTMKASLVFQ